MPALLRSSVLARVPAALLAAMLTFSANAEILPPGHRPLPPGVHVLAGARVVTKPGEVLDPGTILIRDGYIAAVGEKLDAPASARAWDLSGLTVYPGFIDCYLTLESSNAPVSTTRTEPIDLDLSA
jgi:hypothetical protein